MAGHSKWANIKHRKGAQDKKRGKIFTKLIREITVAAKGAIDVNSPKIRQAVDKALAANMPRDTIDRAVKRGMGGSDGANLVEVRYEGYGPAGSAIIVDCLTDNHKRTVAEVRFCFSKYAGNMGNDGCVSYMFTKIGQLLYAPGADEDKIMEIAMDSGAEDIITADDGSIEVITTPENFLTAKEALANAGVAPDNSDIIMNPATTVTLSGDEIEKYNRLFDALDDLDDVQNVYSNVELEE